MAQVTEEQLQQALAARDAAWAQIAERLQGELNRARDINDQLGEEMRDVRAHWQAYAQNVPSMS